MKHGLQNCACGGRVGKHAAVKYHPRLNLLDGIVRYDVRCSRCKKRATTKDGKGYILPTRAAQAWNTHNELP